MTTRSSEHRLTVAAESAPSSLHSVPRLEQWLADDLDDPAALDVLPACAPEIAACAAVAARWGVAHGRDALARLARDPRDVGALRDLFLETLFSAPSVGAQRARLSAPYPRCLAPRLTCPNALPTLDVLVALAPSRRWTSAIPRIAALAAALLELHDELPAADPRAQAVFGSHLAPEADAYRFVPARAGAPYFCVLVRGRVFRVELPPGPRAGARFAPIARAIGSIVAEATASPRAPSVLAISALERQAWWRAERALTASAANREALDCLRHALFVVAYDADGGAADDDDDTYRRLFAGCANNRWFGKTQIVVDERANAGVTLSYLKASEGAQAVWLGERLHARAEAMAVVNSSAVAPLPSSAAPFTDVPQTVLDASLGASGFHNDARYLHRLPVGSADFRRLSLAPHSAIHLLVCVAAAQVAGPSARPSASQAIGTPHFGLAALGTDWLFTSPASLDPLLELGRQSHDEAAFRGVFRACEAHHRSRIREAKRGGTPSYWVSGNLPAPFLDTLVALFLKVGARAPAYRYYLFRAQRPSGAVDIITSSIAVPESIRFCSRPGTLSTALAQFGVHVVLRETDVELVFMPNPAFRDRVGAVADRAAALARSLGA